ncbi:hypothetical protein, partial [Cellulomonas algicola]|uniref:hypothetical protein n=1 Tax=Cellulomonas algicola TaxID=2071633 RepID=UPI001B355CBE
MARGGVAWPAADVTTAVVGVRVGSGVPFAGTAAGVGAVNAGRAVAPAAVAADGTGRTRPG